MVNALNPKYNNLFRRIPDGKAPRFPKKPTIRQEGDVLIMECLLEAHPDPDITWFQGEKSIADSSRVRMLRKNTSKDAYLLTLEIANPTRDDGGNYRCNAFNLYGESNANIALNFQGMTPKEGITTPYSLFNIFLCLVKRLNSVTYFPICSSAVNFIYIYILFDLCLLSNFA